MSSPFHFDIHASIVFQLGEDLITDVVQALVELAKNSYDADADYAELTVTTNKENDYPETFYPGAMGTILVKDNGIGMNEEDIRRGWLTISNSMKREMKKSNQTTREKHRTPLGDKGLGRLGVQRLGYNVEIFTKPKGDDYEYHLGWSWKDFVGENTLGRVKLHFNKTRSNRKRGTTLLISDLRDSEYWTNKDTYEEFERKLSGLISPYSNFREFTVSASVNGKKAELAEISERVRRLAHLRYKIDFDGEKLNIGGRASLGFLRPSSGADAIAIFHKLAEEDNGEAFFEFLSSRPQAESIKLKRAKAASWFVEYSHSSLFEDIVGLRFVDQNVDENTGDSDQAAFASPGPFYAEIDAFDLSSRTASEQNTFDSTAEYRKYIKDLSGVRIFRDGFGIRVDRDWLGLGKQWTGAQSYYALKPENTMGFVAITAKDNACLIETTDREGFKNTPHFDNFLAILRDFVKFAHDSQEFLRRGWLDFVKENQRVAAEVLATETPEVLQKQLDQGLSRARVLSEPVSKAQVSLSQVRDQVNETLDRMQKSAGNSRDSKELKTISVDLKQKLDETEKVLKQVNEFVGDASRLREVAAVLQNEMMSLREQLEETYEVVSLGLTAEALSHEILNVADHMAEKTQDVARYLSRKNISDAKVFAYIEYVKTAIAALRKQMSHLAPSLKYVRDQRSEIVLTEFLHEIDEYYKLRWDAEPLKLSIRTRGEDIAIRINKGKLTQVIDNLILNSEYWIRESIRTGRIKEGVISLDVSSPFLRVSDNGPGIDPSIEVTLFEPFVSKKPKQKGRGLGLYIVRQLLETEGCSISLASKRNERGRLYQFQLDFTGALDGNR